MAKKAIAHTIGPLYVDDDGNLLVSLAGAVATINADVVDIDINAIVDAIKALSGADLELIATAPVDMTAGNNEDLLEGVSAPGEGKAIWVLGVTSTATADGTIKYHDEGGVKRSGTMPIMASSGHAIGYSGNARVPAIMFGENKKPQADLSGCNIGGVATYAIVKVL